MKWHPGLPDSKTLDLVDVFLFMLDSRIPRTSIKLSEPYLLKKRRIYVMSKPDLADPDMNRMWVRNLRDNGETVVAVDSRKGAGVSDLLNIIKDNYGRPSQKRPVRTMLFGLPNVGKSSLANRLLGTKKAPFGARPGLTRGSHWLRGKGALEILDTPGVVDTSLVKDETKNKLAVTWALRDNIYDAEQVAYWLVLEVQGKDADCAGVLEEFGKVRGYLAKGGVVDMERTCASYIHAFRKGELGRFTLETP